MRKFGRLLGLMTAVCLLVSLSGTPALGESAYKEEFAQTGGWPPDNIGSWVGKYGTMWGMFTFYRNGRYDMTVFDTPSENRTGTSKTLEPADAASVEGDILHIEDYGIKTDLRKISMPYVRLNAEEETAASGMDPALIRTFGGEKSGVYVEWTFHGDGRFTQVTPYEELEENGTYVAGSGELAILLGGKVSKHAYTLAAGRLTFETEGTEQITLTKRNGPLVQLPDQWQIDTFEAAENAYMDEFAETGGWPPENTGSWVGKYMSMWGMFTFYPNGRYDMTVFDTPYENRTGTSKTLEPADAASVEGDILHIEDYGVKADLRKVNLPYVRLKAEEEAAAPGMDPALIGTFGGEKSGVYVEWTFHGDGRLTQVSPYEDLRVNGTYFTGSEELAILLDGKIVKYPYRTTVARLILDPEGDKSVTLVKKTGPLVQLPNQWKIDKQVP